MGTKYVCFFISTDFLRLLISKQRLGLKRTGLPEFSENRPCSQQFQPIRTTNGIFNRYQRKEEKDETRQKDIGTVIGPGLYS